MGANAGAAAALRAAAQVGTRIHGVVTRGARVGLGGETLSRVQSPVLLVIGDADRPLLAHNEAALRHLPREAHCVLVRGAGHNFAEPGAIGAFAEHTIKWLGQISTARYRFPRGGTRTSPEAAQ
jgi:hypothetical protein